MATLIPVALAGGWLARRYGIREPLLRSEAFAIPVVIGLTAGLSFAFVQTAGNGDAAGVGFVLAVVQRGVLDGTFGTIQMTGLWITLGRRDWKPVTLATGLAIGLHAVVNSAGHLTNHVGRALIFAAVGIVLVVLLKTLPKTAMYQHWPPEVKRRAVARI